VDVFTGGFVGAECFDAFEAAVLFEAALETVTFIAALFTIVGLVDAVMEA
jgi:hypothetical protein